MVSLKLTAAVARAGRIGRRVVAAVGWHKYLNYKTADEEKSINCNITEGKPAETKKVGDPRSRVVSGPFLPLRHGDKRT